MLLHHVPITTMKKVKVSESQFSKFHFLNALGGLAIAVPGEIRGMYQAWKEHGNLPWKDLVQPAINITQRGFQVPQRMHEAAHIWRYHVESDPGLR